MASNQDKKRNKMRCEVNLAAHNLNKTSEITMIAYEALAKATEVKKFRWEQAQPLELMTVSEFAELLTNDASDLPIKLIGDMLRLFSSEIGAVSTFIEHIEPEQAVQMKSLTTALAAVNDYYNSTTPHQGPHMEVNLGGVTGNSGNHSSNVGSHNTTSNDSHQTQSVDVVQQATSDLLTEVNKSLLPPEQKQNIIRKLIGGGLAGITDAFKELLPSDTDSNDGEE